MLSKHSKYIKENIFPAEIKTCAVSLKKSFIWLNMEIKVIFIKLMWKLCANLSMRLSSLCTCKGICELYMSLFKWVSYIHKLSSLLHRFPTNQSFVPQWVTPVYPHCYHSALLCKLCIHFQLYMKCSYIYWLPSSPQLRARTEPRGKRSHAEGS